MHLLDAWTLFHPKISKMAGFGKSQGITETLSIYNPSYHVSIYTVVLLNIMIFRVVDAELPGTWELLVENGGIASMHTAVTHYGTMVLLDRTYIGESRISLPKGKCRDNPNDQALQHDCGAHSVLFNPATNDI